METEPVYIFVNCSSTGGSPVMISASDQVILYWRWAAATREQMIAHWDSAVYTITLDGKIITADSTTGIIFDEQENYYSRSKYAHIGTMTSGEHYTERHLSWNYQITDGWTAYGPGGEFDELIDGCAIIVRE